MENNLIVVSLLVAFLEIHTCSFSCASANERNCYHCFGQLAELLALEAWSPIYFVCRICYSLQAWMTCSYSRCGLMYHYFCHLNLWNCPHFQLKEKETTLIRAASYERLMWLHIKNVNGYSSEKLNIGWLQQKPLPKRSKYCMLLTLLLLGI